MDNNLVAIAAPSLHDKVIRVVASLPGLDVLDTPAGFGALTQRLLASGKRVTSGDIDITKFRLSPDTENLRLIKLDLNEVRLPLDDETFDLAISVEGIEHLQCQWNLVRNLNRVLRRGGHLVLTTPNILNFRSRLRFFLEGRYEHFKRPLDKDKSWQDDLDNYHIAPVSLFELQFMLQSCGFTIISVETNQLTSKSLLSVLLKPFFSLAYSYKDSRDRKRGRGTHGDFYRLIMSDAVYYGECIIVTACKRGA